MSASYPNSIKTFTNPSGTDKLSSPPHALQHENENDEITAIETELGTLAKGAFGSVRERFVDIETDIGNIKVPFTNASSYGSSKTDVEIQAALDAVHTNGGGAVYIPWGTWLLSTALKVYDDTMVFGDGFYTILKQADAKQLSYLIRSSNVAFENHYRSMMANLQIDGNYANQTYPNPWDGGFNAAGILADGWNDSIFYNLLIKNCGIYGGLCSYGSNVKMYNLTIRDTQATSSGQYASGILIDSVSSVNTKVSHCRIIDVEGKGIYMEDHPSQISIDHCHISGGREGIVTDATEITNLNIDHCIIRDTTALYGIQLGGATTEYTIDHNHVFNNYWHGIYSTGGNGSITGNVVYNNGQGTAATYHGIVLGNSDITATGNRCFDNQGVKTQQYGIHIPNGCLRNTAVGNACNGNNSTGVQNDGGVTNEVAHNT